MRFSIKAAFIVAPFILYLGGMYAFLNSEKHTNTVIYTKAPEIITKPLPDKKGQKHIRILSLQGGGMLGLVELAALEWLEKKSGKPIAELFDIVAGTSTGSIIGAGLLTPDIHGNPKYTASDLRKIYLDGSTSVFHKSIWSMLFTANGLFGAQFPSQPRRSYLDALYGDTHFQDLLRPMLVPVFDVLNNQPIIHLNWYSSWEPTLNHRVADLINGATSTPVLFAPLFIRDTTGKLESIFADGGAFLNNPSLAASLITSVHYPDHKLIIVSLGINDLRRPSNMTLLRNGGIMGWGISYLTEVLVNGATRWRKELLDEALHLRFWENDQVFDIYAQIPPNVKGSLISAHDPESLEAINQIAENMIQENREMLEQLAEQLVAP